MNYNEDKERAELLQRFAADLANPFSERYYSEEELMEIFDTAGDYNDDYMQLEALMLGARLYPDSTVLTERRAIFLLGFEGDAFERFMNLHHADSTPIMELLKLRARVSSGSSIDREKFVADFLDQHTLDSDELVIQFVRTIEDLGLMQWLKDNYEKIEARVEYKPVLYYEVAAICSDADYELAIRALEALTNAEPYSSEYWTMLAGAYIAANRRDDAAAAIEYALAINPKELAALEKKIILEEHKGSKYVDKIVDQVLDIDPTNPDFNIRAIAYAVANSSKKRLRSVLKRVMPYCASSPEAVSACIGCDYPDLDTVFSNFYDAMGPDDSTLWGSLVMMAINKNDPNAIRAILECFRKHGTLLNNPFVALRFAYDTDNLVAALQLFNNEDHARILFSPQYFIRTNLMLLMLYLRNDPSQALECINMISDHLEQGAAASPLEIYAVKNILQDIKKRLGYKRATDWYKYDINHLLA